MPAHHRVKSPLTISEMRTDWERRPLRTAYASAAGCGPRRNLDCGSWSQSCGLASDISGMVMKWMEKPTPWARGRRAGSGGGGRFIGDGGLFDLGEGPAGHGAVGF